MFGLLLGVEGRTNLGGAGSGELRGELYRKIINSRMSVGTSARVILVMPEVIDRRCGGVPAGTF